MDSNLLKTAVKRLINMQQEKQFIQKYCTKILNLMQ